LPRKGDPAHVGKMVEKNRSELRSRTVSLNCGLINRPPTMTQPSHVVENDAGGHGWER